MAGVSINLLPGEFKIDQKAQKKFRVVQGISILILLFLIFLASLSSAFRLLQLQDIKHLKKDEDEAVNKVSSLKEKEVTLVVLKNRLSTISKLLKLGPDNSQIYKQIASLIPSSVTVTSISVDQVGSVNMSIVAPDLEALNGVFVNLTSKKSFETISQVEFESLSRSRDGIYRSNLRILSL